MQRIFLFFTLALAAAMALPSPANADYTRIEQDHPSVSYTGAWETYTGASLSGGSLFATRQESATVSVTFTGTGISWLSYQSSTTRGTTRIYLDGVLIGGTGPVVGVIDFYMAKQWKFGIAGLAHGTHVLKIEVTSEFPGNYTTIAVDAFIIETGAVTQLREENDTSVTYTGTWMDIDDPSVSGGSVLASREAGATATLRFRGTGIAWIGYRCACADGFAKVTLDGNAGSTLYVPVNATERHAQSLIYNRTGLTDGEHELKIEVEGRALGDHGPWVVIDAFRVQVGTTDGPDTTPPQVVLRAPTEGTVFGRERLIADAFDNVGVTSLRYYVDAIEFNPEGTLATSGLINLWFNPAFSPRNVSNGPHVLTAVARDAAGNETRSAPVTVIVDITPPTVTLTSPAPNSQVTGVVTLSATATGDMYGSGSVRFFARSSDGTVTDLGADYDAPYSVQRNTSSIPSGRTFTLWAQVYDAGGVPVDSPPIQVTIQH